MNHRIVDMLETGPDDSDTRHIIAVRETGANEHISKHAVTLCGVAYHEHDSWVAGRMGVESANCQQCRVNARIIGWLE